MKNAHKYMHACCVLKVREPSRRKINARFVEINKWCDDPANKGFVWQKVSAHASCMHLGFV